MSACQDDMVPRHGFSPQQGIDELSIMVIGEGQIVTFEYKYSNPFNNNQLGLTLFPKQVLGSKTKYRNFSVSHTAMLRAHAHES